jgi:CHAT domain-containing protein
VHKALVAILVGLFVSVQVCTAHAQTDSASVDEQLAVANRSIIDGHVKDGVNRLELLLGQLDPTRDRDAYWRTAATLIEWLSQTENHAEETKVLNTLAAAKIWENQPAYVPWMQFFVGRNLAFTGHPDDAEKYLHIVTGGDARLVHIPLQRAAAVILSKIELDRNNISQAAIWIRRAVIGTMVDKGASSEEAVDVLTEYAYFLMRTRKLVEAMVLFGRLGDIYESSFAHHSPKYLHFLSLFVATTATIGNFATADAIQKRLSESVSSVDVVAKSVHDELFFQELYQLARTPPINGHSQVTERLQQIISSNPDFLKNPHSRIISSYLAVLGGNFELGEKYFLSDSTIPQDEQYRSYDIILKSFFLAARHENRAESIALANQALAAIREAYKPLENESGSRLPALTIEERLILSVILGIDASRNFTLDQGDILFRLGQFLNRDKGKLGLHQRIIRQELKSDLQREDLRTRDRLQQLRDGMMDEATTTLLSRVLPIKNYVTGLKNDFAFLIRLEDLEDRISTTDQQLKQSIPSYSKLFDDSETGLGAVQKIVSPKEALVLHVVVVGMGLVTGCITSENITFNVTKFDLAETQQFTVDEKLLVYAVHRTDQPSAVLDSQFPAQSSYRLYQKLFGGVGPCLKGKTHILLATDPDFFALPWNALLTKEPSETSGFSFREASWLPKFYSISLLPSIQSLYELRTNFPRSAARNKFLGIGDPDFKGTTQSSTQVSLAPLFSTRGVGNLKAIADLPALPETADELRGVAHALGAPTNDLLLGSEASEHEFRKRPLNDYRVISFATHAIVAGEIEGVTEPALVLSPGQDEHNPWNDGLLTASEIANLTLDANLVILSACDTAASDGHASGRGLSGLADAFFFAGTRSLAVTQWAVASTIAQHLGAGLISRTMASESTGVAEGLREAMLDYIATAKEDYLANPRFWAAFIIAGDGAVRPLDGINSNNDDQDANAIHLDWQRVTEQPSDGEFLALAEASHRSQLYALGVERPPANEKRAGSYIAQVAAGDANVVSRDREVAASGLIGLGDDLAALGFIPAGNKSTAVFQIAR